MGSDSGSLIKVSRHILKTTKDVVGVLLNQEKIRMTNQVSAKQQAEYKQAFDLLDVDQSGRISSAELGKVMEQLGQHPSEADLHAMVSEVDADGDGKKREHRDGRNKSCF